MSGQRGCPLVLLVSFGGCTSDEGRAFRLLSIFVG